MKYIINNEKTKNKDFVYQENDWTGKKTLTYDGIPLTKIDRLNYKLENEGETSTVTIKGNSFSGLSVNMFGNEIEVIRKLAWYELVMAILVFAPCCIFGLIGGICGGVFGTLNLLVIRKIKNIYLKIGSSILFLACSLGLSYLLVALWIVTHLHFN